MKRNKNFQHRNIITKGSEKLELFFDLMQENGWTGRDGWDGNSEDCYYYINTNGQLNFDVEESIENRVDNDEFIDWYSDMLADIAGEKEDVIKVTREEFKKIYDVACSTWKTKLTEFCHEQTFNDKLEFTHDQIKGMLEASTQSQFPIVKQVFHEYNYDKTIDIDKMELIGEVFDSQGSHAMIAISIMDYKSFYLNNEYNWELTTNDNGHTYLIPTKK
jgi:hypothetical protein